ncbi:MAG: HAMP domain-containing sensor histidine kinase [Crocinitomicaceae bacterium]|nr:HAMP domain-containing sensor histidine kinase [Crocinitomicaceae bacterium]
MKRIRVNFILILVVAAMLALLLIQAFQTSALYDQKSTEFKERLTTTLDRIALSHEKAEDIRRYMHVVDRDFSGKYKDILKEEFQNLLSSKEEISIRDTTIFKDGEMQDYLVIEGRTYDSISGLSAEQRVLARDVRKLKDLLGEESADVDKDSLNIAIQLDQRVVQQLFRKTKFINEMIIEAYKNNAYQNQSDRVELSFLDSVLKTELMTGKFPKDYVFMVTDAYNQPLDFEKTPSNYSSKLDSAEASRTQLFPGNSLDEELFLHVSFPKQKSFLIKEMWAPLLVNFALVLLIIVAFVFMFRTILTQKKLSELKSDFISNMTHEFKTPISTISLACQAMNDKDMMGETALETSAPYVKMISAENERLGILVERILQSATLDKKEVRMRNEELKLNEIISDIAERAKFGITHPDGKISVSIPDEVITTVGDRFHVTNMISNLIDNAIKYSNGKPTVDVSLTREGNKTLIAVKDQGVGIKKEHINKIFDKLYRIPTGNVHNVKGFGLGLSYVKAIAELHGWTVNVKSKFGGGSEFIVTITD